MLFPDVGFTKGEVIDYYSRVADVLLPHLAGRALTMIRFPNGIEGHSFFEKNAPKSTPSWVRKVTLPAPGSTKNRATIDYIVVEELATLVWLANMAAIELHVHQWRVDDDGAALPADQLVVDLDPGAPAGLAECAEVALMLREHLTEAGLTPVVKTSGSKGMQLTAPIEPTDSGVVSEYMHEVARQLEKEHEGPGAVGDDARASARQGVPGLEPEQRGQDHGRAVLAARPARCDRVDTVDLGRGRGRRSDPAARAGGTRADRRARRPLRHHPGRLVARRDPPELDSKPESGAHRFSLANLYAPDSDFQRGRAGRALRGRHFRRLGWLSTWQRRAEWGPEWI